MPLRIRTTHTDLRQLCQDVTVVEFDGVDMNSHDEHATEQTTDPSAQHTLKRTVKELERVLTVLKQKANDSSTTEVLVVEPARAEPPQKEDDQTLSSAVTTPACAPSPAAVSGILGSTACSRSPSSRPIDGVEACSEKENLPTTSTAPTHSGNQSGSVCARSTLPNARASALPRSTSFLNVPGRTIYQTQPVSLGFLRHPSIPVLFTTAGPAPPAPTLSSRPRSSDSRAPTQSESPARPVAKRRRPQHAEIVEAAKKRRKTKAIQTKYGFPLFCLFKGCNEEVKQKPYTTLRGRDRHLDTHFANRYPCSKCHVYFTRKDHAVKHERSCVCTDFEGKEEPKPAVWTMRWPEHFKEPPVDDPLREYYDLFVKTKARVAEDDDEHEQEVDKAESGDGNVSDASSALTEI